jgi:hypothetical protein
MEEYTEEIIETTRKLASIQRILAIDPIEGADKIEVATILGWKIVAKKGEFKIGQLVVYLEIDSILPSRPEYSFLEKVSYRIKTIRLKKQISQGIIFPLDVLMWNPNYELMIPDEGLIENAFIVDNECVDGYHRICPIIEGYDVTSWLGVTKYEPIIPAQLIGISRGSFPSFLKKTDESRIQNNPELLKKYVGTTLRAHEKLDGSSISIYYRDGDFGVCSRNMNLKDTEENSFWQVTKKYKLHEKLPSYGRNICLQGECHGNGIQGNKYNLKNIDLRLFNVFDIDKSEFLNDKDAKNVAKELGVEWCPHVLDYVIREDSTIEELLALAEGPSVLNPNQTREGLVFRPLQESRDDDLGRFSFKAISNAFLLKTGE